MKVLRIRCCAKSPGAVDGSAAITNAAADDARRLGRIVDDVTPDLPAGNGIDRHRALGIGDVHDAGDEERLRFRTVGGGQAGGPRRARCGWWGGGGAASAAWLAVLQAFFLSMDFALHPAITARIACALGTHLPT